METYCVSCKENTMNKNSSVRKTKKKEIILLSSCSVCGKKKLTFIKNKELHYIFALMEYKMNKIINKFLLTGDKFIPELHLRQPKFSYIACGIFSKHRERIFKKIKKQVA